MFSGNEDSWGLICVIGRTDEWKTNMTVYWGCSLLDSLSAFKIKTSLIQRQWLCKLKLE